MTPLSPSEVAALRRRLQIAVAPYLAEDTLDAKSSNASASPSSGASGEVAGVSPTVASSSSSRRTSSTVEITA